MTVDGTEGWPRLVIKLADRVGQLQSTPTTQSQPRYSTHQTCKSNWIISRRKDGRVVMACDIKIKRRKKKRIIISLGSNPLPFNSFFFFFAFSPSGSSAKEWWCRCSSWCLLIPVVSPQAWFYVVRARMVALQLCDHSRSHKLNLFYLWSFVLWFSVSWRRVGPGTKGKRACNLYKHIIIILSSNLPKFHTSTYVQSADLILLQGCTHTAHLSPLLLVRPKTSPLFLPPISPNIRYPAPFPSSACNTPYNPR